MENDLNISFSHFLYDRINCSSSNGIIFLYRLMAATEKDSETGEYVLSPSDDTCDSSFEYDNETGEFDDTIMSLKLRKTANFLIPKNLIAPQDGPKKCCIDPNDTFTLTKKEEVITLQEVCRLNFGFLFLVFNCLGFSAGNHSRLQ